nr:hypothetical protein [Propionibacterium sp.]
MIYLPAFPCDWVLSRWTGRAHTLTIDPIGVECFVAGPPPRRGLFGRRHTAEPTVAVYLHVLVHGEQTSDRIRSWAANQVAQLGVLAERPDAAGDELNRLTAEQAERLAGREWTPAEVVVDQVAHAASAFVAAPDRWAAYVELGPDRVALVGRGLSLAQAALRTASTDEARRLRTDALRV